MLTPIRNELSEVNMNDDLDFTILSSSQYHASLAQEVALMLYGPRPVKSSALIQRKNLELLLKEVIARHQRRLLEKTSI